MIKHQGTTMFNPKLEYISFEFKMKIMKITRVATVAKPQLQLLASKSRSNTRKTLGTIRSTTT